MIKPTFKLTVLVNCETYEIPLETEYDAHETAKAFKLIAPECMCILTRLITPEYYGDMKFI